MAKEANKELRRLPSVEKVLEAEELQAEIDSYSRALVTRSAQEVLAGIRQLILGGGSCPSPAEILEQIKWHLSSEWPAFLTPVINATGVILHTNLGRAPLSRQVANTLANLSDHYYALEYNLTSGQRGPRAPELGKILCRLTGAEGSLVVNNNAAAVFLILTALARDREVIVSRGELVQIGGGFRIPDIMRESGVHLVEVGTTNKTFIQDYEQAITDDTALLLKVHQSNFAIRGFSHSVTTSELKALGARYDRPLVYDLGSGALLATEDLGLEHEPTVQEVLADGADIVCFSGDKLLGGPQSGIILGKKAYLDRLCNHPLLRTVRIGKMTIWALEASLLHYLRKEAESEIPVWRMMGYGLQELTPRAETIAGKLTQAGLAAEVIDGTSMVGGGSLPDQTLDTKLVAIVPPYPLDDFAARLRLATPPLLGRSQDNKFLIDVRTVMPSLDDTLVKVIKGVAKAR